MAKFNQNRMYEKLGEFSKSNIKPSKKTGLKKYAPGGDWPPKWMTEKGANLYFNPLYQNNFTGGTNTYEKNMLGSYRTGFSPVVGIEGSLSKSRRADEEKGRGWLYNAYAGLNPNAMKEGNYTPSAGLNFDFENSPQDRVFRPFAQMGADYNPDTGLNVGATTGARFPFTPYGNKRIKPGYAIGHLDIYGGIRGGYGKMEADGAGPSGGLVYGARVHGKYMPEKKSVLGKLMGKGAYFYGDAGIQFDPQKGQLGQKIQDYTIPSGAVDYYGNAATASGSDQDSGLKFGNTIYANVGVKKELDDIKFKKDNRARKIQEIEDNEKRAFQENEIKEIEKPKKECPEGEERHCEDCPCEPIERVNHPRWLRDGGLIKYPNGGNTCPEGFRYINGECVPDEFMEGCEDGQCRETDEIQAMYDNALDIPRRVVDYEFGIEDLTNEKYAGNARSAWKSQGVKSFVEPSCMYVAGLGWRCAPATKDYMSQFDPINFNSNIGFIHAVDRGDLPFVRVGKFSDRNFDEQSKGNMRIGDVVNFKGADNSHAETFVGYREDGTPMYIDSNGDPSNYSTDSLWTPLRPNTTGKGKDYAYVNRFDTQQYVDDTYGDQIEELERQARENPTYYKKGGLTKFAGGGNPGDKYYRYQNTQYKKDQQGNWYKWNGKTWNMSGNGSYAYDMDNHLYPEDFLQRGSMQADDSNWGNDKPKATVSNYEIQRNQTLNSPFATTTQKIKATNSPIASNVKIQQDLYKQKEKEDKQKELERLEEQRQKHLRTVGSDNTRVDNSIVTNNSLGNIPNIFEQTMSITKAQNDAARQIVGRGDFAQHFPELYKEYMSEENGNREGGPLTMEEIVLREMRTNPDFFSTLESRKEAAWKKGEQKAYDNLAWWEKGINAGQAFIADPLMVTGNALFRGEGPMVGQGEWSIDPERFSAEDNYYYDKFSGKSNSTFNNMFNVINVARAGAGAGLALREGNYGDAAFNLATVIPMVKGAKYGWKGLNALTRTQPLKYIPGLAGTSWGGMTTGQALAGYGAYHSAAYDFPGAFEAYGKGDYGTGNEKLFMGLANAVPFVAEARVGIPSVLDDITMAGAKIKQGYNTVAQGESVLPFAWKSAAAGMNQENSAAMFNKVLNSSEFTNAEKALIREYQYSSYPFIKAGAKQDKFNALIQKVNAKFPENAVVTRKFYGENPQAAFQNVKGEPGKFTEFSVQDRPSAFSVGKGSNANWGKDRIVLSGKNLKKVEGNFVKNTYEPVPEEYYANLSDDALTVMDESKRIKDGYSFNEKVGDNYYGTARLTPEELNAQSEALYNRRVADFNNPENSRFMKPSKVEDFAGKSKDGSADNLYTQEEAEAIVAEQTAKYNERLELYGNPANKDKAIEFIKKENEISFSNKPGVSDERELMGSGFDMKVVGKVKNELGGTDYIVQPRNIRPLKKEPNWQKPSEQQLKQEFKVEHELKGNKYFGSEDEFMNAIKDAKVEEITPELDASISYRSRTSSKEQLVGMSKGYRSWPEFRNEGTIDEIYNGMKSGNKMDMPIVLEFPNGTRRVLSGNTRMDVAFQSGKNPKVLVVKVPDNKALNSISQGNTNAAGLSADANAVKQTSSNLEISQKFDDAENFSKNRITDVEEKRRILRENPDKVVTKYKDIWSGNDELSEVQDLFPFTREGQQQAFDEGTAFAKKWITQDSNKFDELNSAYKSGNEELVQLDMKRGTLENALNREMNGYIEPEIREKAIAEFLKRDPKRQAFDIKNQNGYDPDFVKILIEQNPDDFKFQRLGNIQKQLESVNQRFGELQPEVYGNLRKINENIDPQFRDKVATIYEQSLGPNEMMPNLEVSQAEIHLGNLDDQAKLVQYGKYEPSYLELPQSDQNYLNENLFKTEGVNRAGDSSIEGNILTYGSKPQTLNDQAFFQVVSKSGELSGDPEYVRFVGSFMKDPHAVATTNVHEVAGHQGQKMLGNWMNKLQEYDPEMLYDVPTDKNELAKLFKEALVEPVKGVTLDEAGAAQNVRTNQTWQSSPQELYADVMIARYDLAKMLMKQHQMSMEQAIAEIKSQTNNPFYNEWIANHAEVRQHFKPEASSVLKNQIIKYLPAVVIGTGYGISQGMNSETPQNRYGGNIKTLSKFIRK